jgi:hypothetical protein
MLRTILAFIYFRLSRNAMHLRVFSRVRMGPPGAFYLKSGLNTA